MKIKNLFITAIAILSLSALYSCDEDCEIIVNETERKENVKINYSVTCSKDLQKFVTPILTYTDQNGTHELEITENTWNDSTEYNLSFKKTDEFDHFGIDNTYSVRYVPNEEALSNVDINETYRFYHSLNILSVNVTNRFNIYTNITIDITNKTVKGNEVREYIEELSLTPDTAHVVVDSDGDITVR